MALLETDQRVADLGNSRYFVERGEITIGGSDRPQVFVIVVGDETRTGVLGRAEYTVGGTQLQEVNPGCVAEEILLAQDPARTDGGEQAEALTGGE